MTAQDLLNKLLELQKQGIDLDSLQIEAVEAWSTFLVNSVAVDGPTLVLYND